jgi:hypothetical protein
MCILGPCNYNDWLENLRTNCRPGLALSDWLGAIVFVLMWMCSHTSATDTRQKCRLASDLSPRIYSMLPMEWQYLRQQASGL